MKLQRLKSLQTKGCIKIQIVLRMLWYIIGEKQFSYNVVQIIQPEIYTEISISLVELEG